MAFAIYGSSQLFCVVWQVVLLASFAVITYAYLRIEDLIFTRSAALPKVITYAYLRIEELIEFIKIGMLAGYNLRISAD